MQFQKFFKDYNKSIFDLLDKFDTDLIDQSVKIIDECRKKGGKVYIVGNGGSSSMASHVSVDFAKVAGVPSGTFNNSNLITCFANDYGFEHWAEKAVEFYGDKGDLLLVISSSGKSKNMINAVEAARKRNFESVITLSGFSEHNQLRKIGDINLWVDNMSYNFVENIHQIWLLAIVDLVIGKREYSA